MNAPSIATLNRNVVLGRGRDLIRLMDVLQDECAVELAAAVSGVSVRRIVAAEVPGASAYGLSRAINGADSNPLYRLVAIMVLLKRLGMSRPRAQRIVDFMQAIVNALYGPKEEDGQDQQDKTEGGRA